MCIFVLIVEILLEKESEWWLAAISARKGARTKRRMKMSFPHNCEKHGGYYLKPCADCTAELTEAKLALLPRALAKLAKDHEGCGYANCAYCGPGGIEDAAALFDAAEDKTRADVSGG